MAINLKARVAPLAFERWCNEDSKEFYENMPMDLFQAIADSNGLSTHQDLMLIDTYLQQANRVLEVGAGYGRVIDYLLNKHKNTGIFAIEQSEKYARHLKDSYGAKVNIIHGDIKTHPFNTPFDVILWMWSGCVEFTSHEKNTVFKKLYDFMTKDGTLIMDFYDPQKNLAYPGCNFRLQNRTHEMKFPFGSIYGSTPDNEEIYKLSLSAGFYIKETFMYSVTEKKERVMYIFKKIN